VCMGHDHSCPGIEGQGQPHPPNPNLNPNPNTVAVTDPRSRTVFYFYAIIKQEALQMKTDNAMHHTYEILHLKRLAIRE